MSLLLPLAFLLRFGLNYLPGVAFFVILLHFKGGLSSSFILSFLPILLVHADGEAYSKGQSSTELFRHFKCLVRMAFNALYEWGVKWLVLNCSSVVSKCGVTRVKRVESFFMLSHEFDFMSFNWMGSDNNCFCYCCFVLFSVTHTPLCVSTKWGVTAIILYCCCLLSFI